MVGEPQIGLNDKLKFYGVDPSSTTAEKHHHRRCHKKYPSMEILFDESFRTMAVWEVFHFSQTLSCREWQLFYSFKSLKVLTFQQMTL
ncbi:CLUMA_CG006058, isoform A [Clunio marinus]|uniref:CLUMA_CG006058, isoform A n=1 Tax=Clunio marinus TaxID=568069 RepID=A0A1J1HWQ6_9DIPT|nr:CLUMA_CG006058, isoform A [Clunio marinus]